MAKINILDKKIYNRIAAGEVVERPYSVIKELIENAIDAGATDIDVTIEDGGKRLMRVSDNGCGISREDLPKAFLPHATSKISAVEDLDKILTLGFRGEALASIGSVSKATILSKTKDDEMGNIIVCEGGVIGDADVYPSDTGTTVSVENLFFNTPARAKFLKASKSEKNGIKISGFIGKNYFTKPNRTYQTVILNGRYVVNNTIQSSMHNAYAAYLMKRQYPFYVLKIDMSPETVDVNVHPNKTDVRFIDNQVIYSTLYSVVTKVLDGSAAALEIVKPNNYVPIDEGSRPIIPQKPITPDEIGEAHCDRPFVSGFNEELLDQTIWGRYNKSKSAEKEGEFEKTFGVADSHDDEPRELGGNKIDDIFAENKKYIAEMEAKKAAEEAEKARQEELKVEPEFKIIGQVLATYLILEKENDIYFIDQHAAHERLLYDKFIEEYKSGNVAEQTMLVPYIFRVNESESEFIIGKFPELRKAGFDISEYDVNEFAVYSVPVLLFDMDLKSFFDDLLSDISFKKETMPELIHDKIAMKACKAAIKSGKILSEDEIDALLKAMKYNTALRCPHGRPVTVKISRTEIDKWFKRIV